MTMIKHINIDLRSFQLSSSVLLDPHILGTVLLDPHILGAVSLDPHILGTFLCVLWQEVIFAVLIRWISEMT